MNRRIFLKAAGIGLAAGLAGSTGLPKALAAATPKTVTQTEQVLSIQDFPTLKSMASACQVIQIEKTRRGLLATLEYRGHRFQLISLTGKNWYTPGFSGKMAE